MTTYAQDLSQAAIVWCPFAEKEAYAPRGFCQFCGSTGHEAKAEVKTTKPRTLPYAKYQRDLDAQIAAAGVTKEQTSAVVAYYREHPLVAPSGGQTQYRDAGTSERYTVGYGGERSYAQPAPAKSFTPSEAQIKFLNDLLASREHSYTEAQIAEGRTDWRKIRPMLDELKVSARRDPRALKAKVEEAPTSAPAPARARLDFSSIADGNYALPGEGEEIKFYRVSTNRGYKNVQVRASDTLYPTKAKQGIAILHKIVEFGLEKSQMLFATELGRCWMCGKTLTDEVSRARGMGPDCASK